MKNPLKITKTCYSKIAINECLTKKEDKKTVEEYQDLFIELARVLFEIDNCETKNELNDKFNNGILNPVGTQEHKDKEEADIILFSRRLLWMENDFDINQSIYTIDDVFNNLDKFRFL